MHSLISSGDGLRSRTALPRTVSSTTGSPALSLISHISDILYFERPITVPIVPKYESTLSFPHIFAFINLPLPSLLVYIYEK